MACVFFIAFFSASLDIVVDAYRIEYLKVSEYGIGASMAQFGYRVGMLISGAGALFLAEYTSFAFAYFIFSMIYVAGICLTMLIPEPKFPSESMHKFKNLTEKIKSSIIDPFKDFARN